MTELRDIRIEVPVLARVEGEGALELEARNGKIEHLRLRIFEPPRYFEKFLEGRSYQAVLDIVARICGICPVAYQMSAVQAIEQAFGVTPSAWVTDQRRLMYCGEWLQSHALHIHLLALPDFLGFDNGIAMAAKYPEEVKRGLRLQRLGNDIIALFGGRSVHPIGVRPGGFHHNLNPEQLARCLEGLRTALPDARALVGWTAGLSLPDDQQDFTNVALRHASEYAMYSGRVISDQGHDLAVDEYERHFRELHEAHSTALYSLLDGRPYLVGPLARLNLNHDQLSPAAQQALAETGWQLPSRNMFHSIIARAVETYEVVLEAIRLLENHQPTDTPYVVCEPRAGEGFGATEAPRGLLWHHYRFSEDGKVLHARIVPPTAQNQARMEEDLRQSLEAFGLHHEDDAIRLRGETVIRNYDPCISCATHFLTLKMRR
ncbi:Ni/Fe hydrogenase subunit alpha [Thiorhodospira sibirica]|uniref:Ni/Fe hydrogenase subunit alpha n=1 Tax=Thiorhodospira sibirica TaxID=154347 RepID=UPI00022C111C|nr:Ni/Fe hydrogenase subunit alpha [Thiorhodospira sibirica]